MILVTGGTGFIGKALIRHLVEMGYPVRTLVRPASRSPNLPRGVAVDVAVCGLGDERGLRAAMVGVEVVYHLVSGEFRGTAQNLKETDVEATQAVVEAAADAGVKRLFYLSHLGADRASGYPVFKTKAIAEDNIRRSGLDYTIIRSAVVFGPNDHLTTGIAQLLGASPFIFLMPGNGRALLQPIWVEDLVTCLAWALEDNETKNRTVEVGGPEYLRLEQVVELVMHATGQRRRLVYRSFNFVKWLTITLDSIFPGLPVSAYWLDYLAVNRICSLDTAPRVFNLIPAQMSQRLAYLEGQNWNIPLKRLLQKRA